MKSRRIAVLAALFSVLVSNSMTTSAAEPYVFKGPKGVEVQAEIGSFTVPENRANPDSRMLTLKYVRFPAETNTPVDPVVYLSGGPGGSATGTAKGPRFPLFMEMRKTADVILFDQRGTGLSDELDDCRPPGQTGMEVPSSETGMMAFYQSGIKHCLTEWKSKGYDLNGYNTKESAADLEALRQHLKARKLNLWGISYGTHLAFTTAKYFPETVGKMVLASSEGMDHTIKLPSRGEALLERIEARIAEDAEASKKYPHLIQLMRRVLDRLEANPVIAETENRKGETMTVGIGKLDLQMLTSYVFLKNPDMLSKMPAFYALLDAGQNAMAAQYIGMLKGYFGNLNPMTLAMDSASGITEKRWAQVQEEAKTATLGRVANLPFPDVASWVGVKDLGDEFREEVKSDIPTMFLAGDLDGRTLIESQKELAEGFSNKHFITIKNGGHDLFVLSPEIIERMRAFYEGKPVSDSTIDAGPVKFM